MRRSVLKTNWIVAVVTAGILPVALAGCVGATEEMTADENVGEAQSALCTTATPVSGSGQLIMGDVGGLVFASSASSTYGSVDCSGRFLLEATSTNGKPNLFAYSDWADTLPTGTNCMNSHIDEDIYGFNTGTSTWDTLISHTVDGVGNPCSFNTGWAPNNTIYSKVRIAAKAYTIVSSTPVAKKVSDTITAHF